MHHVVTRSDGRSHRDEEVLCQDHFEALKWRDKMTVATGHKHCVLSPTPTHPRMMDIVMAQIAIAQHIER